MRSAGILCAVSSLPGQCGIGDFSKPAYQFCDLLAASGCTIWQILPLAPLGYGNSPYQTTSSYAIDEVYLDLEDLCRQGLLDNWQPLLPGDKVDYDTARQLKNEYARLAFARFDVTDNEFAGFAQRSWVRSFSRYNALKRLNNQCSWNVWEIHQCSMEAVNYECFLQFQLERQWQQLKIYANQKGIRILGDLPFYVGYDSEEVWAQPQLFQLTPEGSPVQVAGVPPDYFSTDGQLWGNPIYNWEAMAAEHFNFWQRRLTHLARRYDMIRIDHFRAFDTYWSIPADSQTAQNGQWLLGHGYAVFDEVLPQLQDTEIIAEDLGELRPEVVVLRDHYGFKGMQVLQFCVWDEDKSWAQRSNIVLYTGTHDNQTLAGWLAGLKREQQEQIRQLVTCAGIRRRQLRDSLIDLVMGCEPEYVIIPLQDLLGLDDQARMNTPGTLGEPNWQWQLTDLEGFGRRVAFMHSLLRKHRRLR